MPVVEDLGALSARSDTKTCVEWLSVDLSGHGDRTSLDLERASKWTTAMPDDVVDAASRLSHPPLRVGVGMSLGGAALVLAQMRKPDLFTHLFLLEPVIGVGPPTTAPLLFTNVSSPNAPMAASARRRRNNFASVAEAEQYFASRRAFAGFDKRSVREYCAGGLKKRRASDGGGYSLCAEPAFEAEIYTLFPHFAPETLAQIGKTCNVTLVAGSDSGFMGGAPGYYRNLAGLIGSEQPVVEIEGASHFSPLEKPMDVARVLVRVLLSSEGVAAAASASSRL